MPLITCPESSRFCKYSHRSACPVGFADGNKTYAIHTGVFHLSNNIILSNVLFCAELEWFPYLCFKAASLNQLFCASKGYLMCFTGSFNEVADCSR